MFLQIGSLLYYCREFVVSKAYEMRPSGARNIIFHQILDSFPVLTNTRNENGEPSDCRSSAKVPARPGDMDTVVNSDWSADKS